MFGWIVAFRSANGLADDGVDDYPDSMLDLAFFYMPGRAQPVAELAGLEPHATSAVVVRDGDFPDDKTTSDHRPVTMTVDFLNRVGVE
ncbi:MAG: hypothetical protein ACR2NU_13050 [Aeoliella sp.]